MEVAGNPIPGSVNFPRGLLEMKMLEHCQDADTPIYVHCASGARATLAAEQLQRLGYSKVSAISCRPREGSVTMEKGSERGTHA